LQSKPRVGGGSALVVRRQRITHNKNNIKHIMANETENDMFAPLIEAETNGDNYDISTEDIIARLKKWQSICSFSLGEVEYNTVEIKFKTLPKDIAAFITEAYEFCPDLVADDEEAELAMLKKQLPKTKKLTLWWD
jgi:hypothetical protein